MSGNTRKDSRLIFRCEENKNWRGGAADWRGRRREARTCANRYVHSNGTGTRNWSLNWPLGRSSGRIAKTDRCVPVIERKTGRIANFDRIADIICMILLSPFPIRREAQGDIEKTSKLRQIDFRFISWLSIDYQNHHREISSISECKYVRIEHLDMQISSTSFPRESNSLAHLTKQ
jgi:hypothetical protein